MVDEHHTSRLSLRRFVPQDAEDIVSALNDKEMCRGLTVVPFPYTHADAEWYIAEGSAEAFAVCMHDGTLVGSVGLGKQLGYWIAKSHWGNGYAREASRALLEEHFAWSNDPVCSSYVDDNAGSAAVLRHLGFEIAGHIQLHIRSRNEDVPGKDVVLSKSRWEQMQ